ncbi:hypothetical protein Hneap_2180 [Halothiobacillus neapolitanus c2]|uniref:Uncharacterized protein n=1 Tax=Halothiobacillus neapolitanus (strain ATCC 23641 / DSM 15147 / CIP 104769 / NCIMB 8539 / c2) TaxID=555778 RepID=D0KW93_HALNC|nr:hypothetical protein Hneap_2180 [Halothiobacillus neapolitanus c2]
MSAMHNKVDSALIFYTQCIQKSGLKFEQTYSSATPE